MTDILGNARAIRIPHGKADPILNELVPKLVRFQKLLKEHGTDVEIDSAASREAWLTLPEPAKLGALHGFGAYLENCEELNSSGISLRDNFALLMHSLKKANLFTTEDIRTFLTNDNIVEVYNLDHIQLFRSINFFDLCNYSLLDLLAREWFVLFERLNTDTEANLREFQLAIEAGKSRRQQVKPHLLKERDSNPRGVFYFDPQYVCPVYSAPGVPGGYLLTENVTEIDLFAPGDESFKFLN